MSNAYAFAWNGYAMLPMEQQQQNCCLNEPNRPLLLLMKLLLSIQLIKNVGLFQSLCPIDRATDHHQSAVYAEMYIHYRNFPYSVSPQILMI